MPVPLAPDFATSPFAALSATEQAARIRDGTLTSEALVAHYLERIAAHDGQVNALVQVWGPAAMRAARRADRLRARGRELGPFHGVPTAVKDHHFVRGAVTGFGTRAFPQVPSPVDDVTVRRLRGAGFVLVGKTAMSEVGLLPITETEVAGATRNPWDTSRTAGGSSGGAGAAVAAGLLPVAPGSDGAGSIRIPASLNGLIGLKTSRGLVPLAGPRIDPYGLGVGGPLARSIDDAAALLDVLCHPRDARHLEASRAPVPRLRVGVLREAPFGRLDPAILGRVDAAAEALAAAGHEVVTRPTPEGSVEAFTPLYQSYLGKVPVPFPWRLGDTVRWFWSEGRKVPDAVADAVYRDFTARGLAALDGLDVLLTPTVPDRAPEVGAYDGLAPEDHFRESGWLGTFTAMANVTGAPALTVPYGVVAGLPVGVQLIGHRGRDGLLLALGRQLLGD